MKRTSVFFLVLLLVSFSPLLAKEGIPTLLKRIENTPKQQRIPIYQDLAWAYKNTDLDSAKYYVEKALELSISYQSPRERFESLNLYGTIEKNRGNYDDAYEYFLQALKIAREAQSPINTSAIFFNLSNLYSSLGEDKKAISSYLHGIELLSPEKSTPENLVTFYMNVSNLYVNIESNDSAKYYMNQAMKLLPRVSDSEILASTYTSFAGVYYVESQLDSAVKYFQKSLEIYENLGDLKWVGISLLSLGGVYSQELNRPQHAIDSFFMPALAIFEKIRNRTQLLEAYDWLTTAYSEIRYDSAYVYLEKYLGLSDTLQEEERLKRIDQLETRYNTAMIDRQRALASTQRNGFIALSIFLALLVVSFAYQYQRTKMKKVLEHQESQEQTRSLLERLKNQEITSMNQMMTLQGDERKRIAADLHDRVGSLLATLKVNYESLEEKILSLGPQVSDSFIRTNKILDQACRDVRAISHDINSGVLTQFGLIPAIEEIKEAIERSGKMVINFDAFGIDERLENTQEIFLYRIVQETITNVIKHAEATEIDIQLSRNDDEISLCIEDNGKGFDPAEVQKKQGGMGLGNLKMRVEQLGGEFSVDSTPGKGCSIMVDVPVNQKRKQ